MKPWDITDPKARLSGERYIYFIELPHIVTSQKYNIQIYSILKYYEELTFHRDTSCNIGVGNGATL